MEAYIYLIQNGDLFYIGISKNLEKEQEILKPGKLCAFLRSKDCENICKNLHSRYSQVRLPKSDYFRLSKSQLLECQLMMKNEDSNKYFEPIFKGANLVITFLMAWFILSGIIIKVAIDPIMSRLL